MKNYLLHEDVWETIVGYPEGDTSPTPIKVRKDRKALAKICLTVDDTAITHIRCAKTAAEAWMSLQNAFEVKGMERRLSLERKLYRLSLSDFDNIESYINAVLSTAQDLADIDKVIEDFLALENCSVPVTTD